MEMEYISTKEAAQKWGISERRVRSLCSEGKIEGATRCGDWVWSIPVGTQKPADGRTLRYMRNRSLRTGVQDYKKADDIRSTFIQAPLSFQQKAQVILEALTFAGEELTIQQVRGILSLQNQKEVSLETQVLALNAQSLLSSIPFTLNEKKLLELHARLLCSVNEKEAGYYKLGATVGQETEAMFEQYTGPWSVLHPVAKAAFLFSEILRIQPFEKGTALIAFVLLQNEMYKAKLPPVLFGETKIPELKAALASTKIRGNSQMLVSMILDATTRE